MTPKNDFVSAELEALSFAPADYSWDEEEASKRLRDSLGLGSLAAYSLWVDTSRDPESAEAYPMLVVDLVDDSPLIVPGALESVENKALALGGEEGNFVLERLATLKARLRAQGPQSPPDADEPENNKGKGAGNDASGAVPRQKCPGEEKANTPGLEKAGQIVAKLRSEGKMLAAWGAQPLAAFIAGLSTEPSLIDDNSGETSPYDFFVRLLESLPSLVPLDELARPAARKDDSMESLGRKIASALNRSTGRNSR
jgi:hypothetical protein